MLTLHLTLTDNQVSVRANGKESHQFSILELDSLLSDAQKQASGLQSFYKNPRVYGEKLFNALFRDVARAEFDALSKQSERTIVLVLESSDPSTTLRASLDGVAWEYAYNKAKEEYVVEDCAFVRALPEKERPANGRLKNEVDRVPLLFIPANPLVDLNGEPMRALDVEGEWREMKRLVEKSNAPFDMIELRPATPEALQSVMARFQNGMIAHFSGHGAATKDGAILLFERENGASNPLEAREFVREIKDKAWIGFLSACQSAVPERTEFSNLARELAKAGVPFALGMQFNLPDPFAPNISGQFYNYLAHGHTVPEAARQARRAVKRESEFFVGMIALYAAHPDEVGKLSWRGVNAQTVSLFRPADVSDLPSPASGLIGRQRELMRIGTRLLEGKKPLTVTLHGAGGIGKTALLREALLRFAPSFELTLAIGLDPLPSLESVLGRIEHFLGLPSPCSNDTQEREALVRNALTSKRTLLGLDNFETLNYALNEKGSDEEKTAKSLHTFFKSLAANGVTLCVTSREVTNLPGETIEDIQGLTNESGGRLFQENVVKQKDEIYIEKTQQVSEMVGGHPLALRLLASAFDDQVGTSLDQYIESLQSFLPKARDKWTEEDRHESLRASFDFTMNNLVKTDEGKELQISLSRLSVFIAFFSADTAAPVIVGKWSENEQEVNEQKGTAQRYVQALWEHGLLERISFPFDKKTDFLYRLHPALNQFAVESIIVEEQDTIKEIYWRTMRELASRANPYIGDDGIYSNPPLAKLAREALPDILKATRIQQEEKSSTLYFDTAFLLYHFGDVDGALKLYQEFLETLKKIGEMEFQPATLNRIAEIYVLRGNLDKAMELYEHALAIDDEIKDLRGQAITLSYMARIYVTRGNLDKALDLDMKSREIMEQIGDVVGKFAVVNDVANIYRTRGEHKEAIRLYNEVLSNKESRSDLRGMAVTLHEMALAYKSVGNLDKALELFHQALEITRDLEDKDGQSAVFHSMANIFRIRGDLDEAKSLYSQALKIEEEIGNLKGQAVTKGDLSSIYIIRGDLYKALEYQEEKLLIVEKIGDQREIVGTLNEIGHTFSKLEDWDKAIELWQRALKLSIELDDLDGKSTSTYYLAESFARKGDLDKALEMYKQAIEIDEQIGDKRGKAASYYGMAYVNELHGNLDEAIVLCQKSLEIDKEIGDKKGCSSNLNQLANLYVARKDLVKAMEFYQMSLQIDEELGDRGGMATTIHGMANIYLTLGELDRAMSLYKQSLEINESLENLEGKAITLVNLGVALFKSKQYQLAMQRMFDAWMLLRKIGAEHDIQGIKNLLVEIRDSISSEEFDPLWKKIANQPIPDWLAHPPGKKN